MNSRDIARDNCELLNWTWKENEKKREKNFYTINRKKSKKENKERNLLRSREFALSDLNK